MHIATSNRDAEHTLRMDGPDGKLLFLDPDPLITETHIRHASFTIDENGRPAVDLDLTEEGAKILLSRSDDYVDRMFAILWDGRVVSAPTVMTPLGSKLMIIGGEDSLSDELIHEIVERLKATDSDN